MTIQQQFKVDTCLNCNKKHVLLYPKNADNSDKQFCLISCEREYATKQLEQDNTIRIVPTTDCKSCVGLCESCVVNDACISTYIPDTTHFKLVPRDYQRTGILRMRQDKRILNRDAVGLGKTLQAIHASEPPVLIACPAYLVSHWHNWILNNTTDFRVVSLTGNQWQKLAALQTYTATHIICSYATVDNPLLRDELLQQAKRQRFRTIIYDETHRIRNHASPRARTWKRIAHPDNCEYFFELTGSPIWKEVDDLFHLFHMLHPDLFPSYNAFTSEFCIYDDSYFARKIIGVKTRMQKPLQDLLDLMSVGRDYATAGRQLPSSIESVHKVKLPSELQKMYDQLVSYWAMIIDLGYDYDEQENVIERKSTVHYDSFMACLHALRQLTAFPGKIEIAEDIIEDLPDNLRVVVFSWYKETADRAYRYLKDKYPSEVTLLTGDTSTDERREIAMNQDNRIICATIGALSEGIDLSDVRCVIFLEEHWAFGSKIQAFGRIQRDRASIPQPFGFEDSPIFTHYVMTENTIDEHIHNVAASREGTAKQVLERTLHK